MFIFDQARQAREGLLCFMADPAEPGAAAGAAGGAAPTGDQGGGRNVVLSPQALKDRVTRARETGRKAALGELDAKAKAAGFKDADEMLARLAALPPAGSTTTRPPAAPARDRGNGGGRRTGQLSEAEQEQLDKLNRKARGEREPQEPVRESRRQREEREALERRAKEADTYKAKNQRLQKRLHAQQAESAFRVMLVENGVRDVDVAHVLLKKKIDTMTVEEAEAFDEVKWVTDILKKDRPYLFGVRVEPATTGTPGTPGNQTANKDSKAAQVDLTGFDATTASDKELREWAQKSGIQLPS